jgi:hypothetical protein
LIKSTKSTIWHPKISLLVVNPSISMKIPKRTFSNEDSKKGTFQNLGSRKTSDMGTPPPF